MTSLKSSRRNKSDFTLNDGNLHRLFENRSTPMWIHDLAPLVFLKTNDAVKE